MTANKLSLREAKRRSNLALIMSDLPSEFIPVAQTADIPPGAMKCVAVDRVRVLLANVDGTLYAIGDMCGHRRAPLSAGQLDGYLVECPLHYAIFDVRTGKFVDGPTSADVPAYETRVDGDTVSVRALTAQ